MNENDKKLLQLYKKDIKRKRIIVFLLILIFIGGCSLYYFYIDLKQSTKESNFNNNEITSNNIELKDTNEENINATNENKIKKTDESKITETTFNKEKTEEIQGQTNKNTNVEKKEDTTKKDNNKKDTTEKVTTNTTEKPKNKDFLFSDGYTMDNVTQAAQNYLKSYNWSGECIPIKDDEGVYLGMRVIFY